MRRHWIVAGWIGAAALLALCMIGGCPQQVEDTNAGMAEPAVDPEAMAQPDAATGETDAETTTGMDVTMAEIMAKWPSSFVMTQTIADPSTGEEMVVTHAVAMGEDGPAKMKMEMAEGAGIIDIDEGVMYTWQVGSNQAMKMELPEEAKDNPYGDVDAATKITGEDIVGDVECWVTEAEAEDEGDGETTRMWWGKDDGLMRRIEVGESVSTFEYEQIDSVPDSEFELPAGMTVQEMPDMPSMPNG